MQPKTGIHPPNLAEARELLCRSDFFPATPKAPTDLKWVSKTDFQFTSSIGSRWPENNVVRGKLLRCGEDWKTKPTVILIHGWNDEVGYMFRQPYQARLLLRAGLNAAMLEMPFHVQRRPKGRGAVVDILSEDLLSNMLAVRQGFSDVRALLSWLEAEGCSRVGLWGASLGGWFSGLVSCHDERVRFAALTTPASRMDQVINDLPFCAPVRQSLNGGSLPFDKLNLRSHRPKVPLEKILIVEGEDDLFISKNGIEEFWEAWGKPEIWRLRHAHITGIFWPPVIQRTVRWIEERTR